jgi:CRP-like cAMP-binding protein
MPDQQIVPLRRLLSLRQFAAFANVDLGDLAMVAENVVESTFPAGAEIASAQARVPALHLVLDGRIEARRGTTIETWGPREVFGLLEVLAGRAATMPAISATETHTLELAATDTLEILEDNFGLLRAVLRGLAASLVSLGGLAAPTGFAMPSTSQLTLVERLIVLRQHVPFVGGRLQALAAVAQACEELSWPAGMAVAHAGNAAEGTLMILDGTLRASHAQGPAKILRAGDTFGSLETLAGLRHELTVETVSPVRAMWCPGAAIVDVLEDHTDLGLEMIATFAKALLDGPDRHAN